MDRKRLSLLIIAVGALVGWLALREPDDATPGSTSAEPGSGRPNVLLITVDTLRADHVGAYGYPHARTFTMDSLATEGVRVERAISAAPITMPSHTTILSGLYPPAHGVRDNGDFRAPDDLVLLPERLVDVGYETRAFVSAIVLDHRYNLDQGFEHYDDELWLEDDPAMFMIRERPAERTVDRVIAWLDERSERDEDRPFFTWMHLFDPHQPYTAPVQDRALVPSRYDGDIAYADRHIGRLFRSLRERGVMDDTLVVLTSDHGESLGEHGEKSHAIFVYEATTRVPLFFRHPGLFPAGEVYPGAVRTVDIMPTILGALGLPLGETQGRDLHEALAGRAEPPELPQYSESLLSQLGFGMAPLFAIRQGDSTFIRAPRPELYDRSADPGERHNLLEPAEGEIGADERARADALDLSLTRILDESAGFGIDASSVEVDAETMEMLRALGYVGDEHSVAAVAGMDPKDGLHIHTLLEDGRHACRNGDMDRAEEILLRLLEEVPGHVSALNTLATVYTNLRRPEDAERILLDSLAAQPNQARVLTSLARIRLSEEDPEGAIARADEALRLSPANVQALVLKGFARLVLGDEEGATALYNQAASEDEGFPRAHSFYADLLFRRGEYEQALRAYERALAIRPELYVVVNQAGVAAKRMGDRETADRYFQRASELREDAWPPVYNLACTAALAGDRDGAIERLREAAERGMAAERVILGDPDLASVRADPRFAGVVEAIRANRALREAAEVDSETEAEG